MEQLKTDVLVNKEFGIDENYEPNDLIELDDNKDNFHNFVNPLARPMISGQIYLPYRRLENASIDAGYHIVVDSGYRSGKYQRDVYRSTLERYYEEYSKIYTRASKDQLYRMAFYRTNIMVAQPGHSEHQTGFAFDAGCYRNGVFSDEFSGSEEAEWLNDNAHRFGFILRYPKGKEDITGYNYEPWHFRYVGEDIASKLYNDGEWITLEEYKLRLKR